MGHDGVASGYPTPTGFHKLTGCLRDPLDRGVTPVSRLVKMVTHHLPRLARSTEVPPTPE